MAKGNGRFPPLNALRAFEAAARHASFKIAAKELHVTPGAVSHQVKLLEQYLGVQLFRRLTRALELTTEAHAMLPKVREGLDALHAAVERVRSREEMASLTVVMPHRSATTAAMPSGRLVGNRPSGSWPTVCPGQAMHSTFCSGRLAASATARAALAKVSPSSRCSRLTWRMSHGPGPATRRISSRSSAG